MRNFTKAELMEWNDDEEYMEPMCFDDDWDKCEFESEEEALECIKSLSYRLEFPFYFIPKAINKNTNKYIAMICPTGFWHSHHNIHDTESTSYAIMQTALMKYNVSMLTDEVVSWKGMSVDTLTKKLEHEDIYLIVNDSTFINEYEKEFNKTPEDFLSKFI